MLIPIDLRRMQDSCSRRSLYRLSVNFQVYYFHFDLTML